ncbi:MAG: hypothetical protein EBX41_00385 [Chitinophagia bacterium]|nr:hypothetical protein [Chitinophagia bacterium]
MNKSILAALCLFSAATCQAGVHKLYVQGIRQLAMGGTGTAWQWDASTIYSNPAGLARLKNLQAYGSVSHIYQADAYGNSLTSESSQAQVLRPINVYFGGTVKKDGNLGLGIGVYSPYSQAIQWDDNWTGRYLVQSYQMSTLFIQPTVAYKFCDEVSVGAGFVIATGVFDYRYALPVQNATGQDAKAQLHSNASGVGFNLGVQVKVSDRVQLGATYRSQVNMEMGGGSANFTVPNTLKPLYPNTRFDGLMPMPQVFSLGVGFKPLNNEKLTMQFDLNYTGWNSYDSLRLNFAQHTTSIEDLHSPRKYRNTLSTHLGANYKVGKVLSLMAGAAYEPTPVTDGYVAPDMPDADRVMFSCGASVHPLHRFTILAALQYNTSMKRRAATYNFANFNGTYLSQTFTPGIGLYYNF